MYAIGERELGASELLHEKLSTSRVGQRWERIVLTHVREVDALMAVHPDLRRHVGEALTRLAGAGTTRLDDAVIGTATVVLDDLNRLGGFELKCAAVTLREELAMARGLSLDDVLAR
jgi:predicted RNase H-like nuclease